jgi:hypothetical protein
MIEATDRNEAIRYIEDLLGPDGSREIAALVVEHLGWRNAIAAARECSPTRWNQIIDEANEVSEGSKP